MIVKKNDQSTSIALLGPGHGNNIDSFLDLISHCNDISITLICREFKLNKNKFDRIQVVEYGHFNKLINRVKFLFSLVRLSSHDLLIVLGGSNLFEVIPALMFVKRKRTVFSVWGETVPKRLDGKGIKAFLYRRIFCSVDAIFCNWYGTKDIILRFMPHIEPKVYIQGWGLSNEFLEQAPIISQFTVDFLSVIPENKYIFLNMRSIDSYNETSKILESMLIIKNESPECFKQLLFIFWHGNNIIVDQLNHIVDFIDLHQMHDHIWCVKHPFIPTSDIRHIVDYCHVVVNFVNRDQLSGSVLEALYLKKKVIMTDIESYRIFNDKFNLELSLITNSTTALVEEISNLVKQLNHCIHAETDELLEHRKKIIEKHFVRANNVQKISEKLSSIMGQ